VETAINRVNDVSPGDGVFGQIGVVHVHGASGTEEPHYAPVPYRNGTTHIRVEGLVDNTFINVRVSTTGEEAITIDFVSTLEGDEGRRARVAPTARNLGCGAG
jgi:hypothetical protein